MGFHLFEFFFQRFFCHLCCQFKDPVCIKAVLFLITVSCCRTEDPHCKDQPFVCVDTICGFEHGLFCLDANLSDLSEESLGVSKPPCSTVKQSGKIRCDRLGAPFKRLNIHIAVCARICTVYQSRLRCGIHLSHQCAVNAAFQFNGCDTSAFTFCIHPVTLLISPGMFLRLFRYACST